MQFLIVVVLLYFGVLPSAFAQTYADEMTDWGIKPTTTLEGNSYHAKTPISVPGAKTITTLELKSILDGPDDLLMFDVLGGDLNKRRVIPGALLLGFDGGDGRVYGVEKARFAKMLSAATNGDKSKPMVFYCLNSHCWLSYNASLRAISEGYQSVLWYRGGVDAWRAAGFRLIGATPYEW